LMRDLCIGNAIVKHSDPLTQVRKLNRLQSKAPIPLLISADAEWGLAMRMQDTIAFPKNRTLGEIEDMTLLYRLGAEIGRQAKRVGIHLNLAPVADVNTNPANPIIGMRSFGEDPRRVASCVRAMVSGMQSAGILACAKHFPGHGDTSVDSHRALPVLEHSRERLDAVEFVPFREAIDSGVVAIMTGHLLAPAIDPRRPATLSSIVLTGILRKELGFDGLIVSDALNMKALSQTPEEAALFAMIAGCDLLLYGDHLAPNIDQIIREDVPRAWAALKEGVSEGMISKERLDASVLRILRAKEQLGLHLSSQVSDVGLFEDLHTDEAALLKKTLFRQAIAANKWPFLPERTAYLALGCKSLPNAPFTSFFGSLDMDEEASRELAEKLKSFDAVVLGIHALGPKDKNYGVSPACLFLIRQFPEALLCHFATPYALPFFSHPGPLCIAFENDPEAVNAVFERLLPDISALP